MDKVVKTFVFNKENKTIDENTICQVEEISIVDLILLCDKSITSKTKARKLIEQNAIKINKETINDINCVVWLVKIL